MKPEFGGTPFMEANKPIIIRYASASDIKECDSIARLYRKELPFISRAQFQQSADQHELLLAEMESEIMGFARFHCRRDGWTSLYDLAVKEKRKGIGERLLQALEPPIRLKIIEENQSGREFYRHLGFVEAGEFLGKNHNLMVLENSAPLVLYVRGGEPRGALACKLAGAAYGIRSDYKAYAQPFMIDINWHQYQWDKYLQKVRFHAPVACMVADYEKKEQRDLMLKQVHDLRALGVMRILVCVKFEEGISDIPEDCIIAISVPTQYAGFLPQSDLAGKRLHLLGGHPDQWNYIIYKRYPKAKVISADGNVAGRRARYGDVWYGDRWTLSPEKKSNAELVAESLISMRNYIRSYRPPRRAGKRVRRCYRDPDLTQLSLL